MNSFKLLNGDGIYTVAQILCEVKCMYESFSVVYDNLVTRENEMAFYSLCDFLDKNNFNGKKIIELACGTGTMALKPRRKCLFL